ncbi:MAG: hypothetical protein KAJ86_04040 [Alphaproteobacteria bacterium]|nr:hypothetical protein [Alphaproteobacteria bacterium]
MFLRSFKYFILITPFMLGACGEGFNQIRTDQMFPYGNQRTAGTSVAYVLAKMMPERELKLPIVKVVPRDLSNEKPEAVKIQEDKMEQLFDEALKK